MRRMVGHLSKIGQVSFIAIVICWAVCVTQNISIAQEEATVPAATQEVDKPKQTFAYFWKAGGIMMWPLGICSLLTLAFTIELILSLKVSKFAPVEIVKTLEEKIKQKEIQSAIEICDKNQSFLAKVLKKGLTIAVETPEKMEEAIAEEGAKEAIDYQHKVGYLSALATIAPMLGLLGTVTGLIQAFYVVAYEAGMGKPTLLAKGVMEALITTVAGMVIGIPAMALYFYFRNKLQKLIIGVEENSTNLVRLIKK